MKPSVDLNPGAHVGVPDAEQGCIESNGEQSLGRGTVDTTVERRCVALGRSAGADALSTLRFIF